MSCPVPTLSHGPRDGAASQIIHTGNDSDTIEPTGRLWSVVWRDLEQLLRSEQRRRLACMRPAIANDLGVVRASNDVE